MFNPNSKSLDICLTALQNIFFKTCHARDDVSQYQSIIIVIFLFLACKFYKSNAACTHRLIPWLLRDLKVLLGNNEKEVNFLVEFILSLITRQAKNFFSLIFYCSYTYMRNKWKIIYGGYEYTVKTTIFRMKKEK